MQQERLCNEFVSHALPKALKHDDVQLSSGLHTSSGVSDNQQPPSALTLGWYGARGWQHSLADSDTTRQLTHSWVVCGCAAGGHTTKTAVTPAAL